MKAVMLMFDSLNRHMLPPYGCTSVVAPNFARLAQRTTTFDRSYVCSMPCMPARRDLLTGRPNFLHRGWGPIEPYDICFTDILRQAGVTSHLLSDHYHYWFEGGESYHPRYDTWQCFRGQEGDPWFGQCAEPVIPANLNGKGRRQDWINRQHMTRDEGFPQHQTYAAGLDFIRRNAPADNWFLQIECFDPHEPFVSPSSCQDLYPTDYDGPLFDWPGYREVQETPAQVAECRRKYAALVSFCDRSLGRVLDLFDQHDLWKDTMLIVWTDHGFLLGEHHAWAKNWTLVYEEISHTPFFLWDPRQPQCAGQRRAALVQPAIDLAPTLLDFFNQPIPEVMTGKALRPVLANDTPVREAAMFGYFGEYINITDGRYVYYRAPQWAGPLHHYTLRPTGFHGFLPDALLRQARLHPPLPISRGMPVLQLPVAGHEPPRYAKTSSLFDLAHDPRQQQPIQDATVEQRLSARLSELMHACHAPDEQWERMGLTR